ncbi:MAG TPA: hypothetical protein PLI27_06280 [Ignavibacteriales bacterium]|nr:hypothetical protein [Ignavibacteriales bacterium]HOL80885.1 hypothetical protein [Ignavibacteriales bacterium]HOM65909.1 hypothetical protein [Ignavibacteriales bacterium]HPD67665.1 hypothetical protein [Ignavibacteriales bacterium]HPP33320.1 hypothetical protein [Ignavibacteriales bacterium]
MDKKGNIAKRISKNFNKDCVSKDIFKELSTLTIDQEIQKIFDKFENKIFVNGEINREIF